MTQFNQDIINQIHGWSDNASKLIEAETYDDEEIPPRRWKGDELAKAVGVANINRIYMAEKRGKLPADYKSIRTEQGGYDLEMVNKARALFGTLPGRCEDDETVVISFTNFKGGCYKTLTTHNIGACAATEGFKVLLVDLDPQASLSLNVGLRPDFDVAYEDTLAPFLIEDEPITQENIRRVVQKTRLHNMDILPASLDLQSTEWQLAAGLTSANFQSLSQEEKAQVQLSYFARVDSCLSVIRDDYDLILLDGTPTLGIIPLNIVFASDIVIVPTPTEMVDFASTTSFLRLLNRQFEVIVERFADQIIFPEIRFLPTRFGTGTNTVSSMSVLNDFIKPAFTTAVMRNVVRKHESAIGATNVYRRTMFEINSGSLPVKKDAREKCINNYKAVFNEIVMESIYPRWPSKKTKLEIMGAI